MYGQAYLPNILYAVGSYSLIKHLFTIVSSELKAPFHYLYSGVGRIPILNEFWVFDTVPFSSLCYGTWVK